MNRGVCIWLIVMIIPFVFGMFMQFLLPLEFILNGHTKVQESYNFFKGEVEQNTVRALSILNSHLLSNRIQIYQSIRASLTRMLGIGNLYLTIRTSSIELNSAYQLATGQQNLSNPDSSMWYSPNY